MATKQKENANKENKKETFDEIKHSVSRPALRPTQPPVQWVPWVFSPGQSAAGT
jgi:hypothetical protein